MNIPLTQGKVAKVDGGDFDSVISHSWYAEKRGGTWYAASRIGGKKTYLHRFILREPEGEVDHRDGDGLNNERLNLRVSTHKQNSQNRKKGVGTRSHYKGAWRNPQGGRWQARIGSPPTCLGTFDYETEAALAYDRAAITRYGEFANLNFPRGRASYIRPTFLFVGFGRAGKDTCAEIFSAITKLRYAGSFSWAGLPFMADFLGLHPMTAWERRHQNRQVWKDRLDHLRAGDETFLAELALASGEVAAGLRDKKELEAVKANRLFTRIFWVERPGTPTDPTVTFTKEDCDEVIHNDGSLIHLHSKLFLIAEKLGLIPDLYLSGKTRITTDLHRD